MISIAYLYTVHIYAYTVDTLLGKPHNVFILCTYICIILCIFLGPQKKVDTENQNYRTVYAKLIIERKK